MKWIWNQLFIIFSQNYRHTNPTIVHVIWKDPKSNKKLATLKKMTDENLERTRKRDIRDVASQKSTKISIPSCPWINSQDSILESLKPKGSPLIVRFDFVSAFRWIRETCFVLWRIWGWAKAHVDWFVPLVFYYKSLPVE